MHRNEVKILLEYMMLELDFIAISSSFIFLRRFGMIQMKLGLGLLLSRFRFNVCEKTDNPIKIDTVNLFHGPAGDVFLNIESV